MGREVPVSELKDGRGAHNYKPGVTDAIQRYVEKHPGARHADMVRAVAKEMKCSEILVRKKTRRFLLEPGIIIRDPGRVDNFLYTPEAFKNRPAPDLTRRACKRCSVVRPLSEFAPKQLLRKGPWCRSCMAKKEHEWASRQGPAKNEARTLARWKRRLKVLQILGGKCVRCGNADLRVLQINHIAGGGIKEYRALNGHLGKFYMAIVSGERRRDDLNLLCANCNVLYEYERGNRRLPAGATTMTLTGTRTEDTVYKYVRKPWENGLSDELRLVTAMVRSGEPLTAKNLAEITHLDPFMVRYFLRVMVSKELVFRSDGRPALFRLQDVFYEKDMFIRLYRALYPIISAHEQKIRLKDAENLEAWGLNWSTLISILAYDMKHLSWEKGSTILDDPS